VKEEIILVHKGVLSKLGIDAQQQAYAKKHFFALYTTNLDYTAFYPDVFAAAELRWSRTECEFKQYSHGTTVKQGYCGAQAIEFLRNHSDNGRTLAEMLRPEDAPRLFVLSTVDGRFVLLMSKEADAVGDNEGTQPNSWMYAVKKALEMNVELVKGVNAAKSAAGGLTAVSSVIPAAVRSTRGSMSIANAGPLVSSSDNPSPIPDEDMDGYHGRRSSGTASQRASLCINFGTAKTAITTLSSYTGPETFPSSLPKSGSDVFGSNPTVEVFPRPPNSILSSLTADGASPTLSTYSFTEPLKASLIKFTHNGKDCHKKQFCLSPSGLIQWGDSDTKYKYSELVKSVLRGHDSNLKIDAKALRVVNPDLIFTVRTTGKQLYLVAPTEAVLNQWVDALEICVQHNINK